GSDAESRVWLTVHSGSRRLGLEVAKHNHAQALAMNRADGVMLPHEDLAFLPEGTPEFEAYTEALAYCLDWAMENRRRMGEAMAAALADALGRRVSMEETLNVHHNVADQERHLGRKVWVHRKGATPAEAGVRGLIPGHMGLGSYLTTGLGSEDSYMSSSHGAGRAMGRNVAKRTLDIESEKAKLDAAGVTLWTPGGYRTALDEMPGAYHEPGLVMERQSDLVHVEGLLRSVGTVKG
ncbi:MAG: RtcB family protein, partial [Desulfobacterales bacterium]|nr:RtcB family protein [Desulfobacterales bacterium]